MIEDSSIFVKMPSELHAGSVQIFSIIAGIQRAFQVKLFFFILYQATSHGDREPSQVTFFVFHGGTVLQNLSSMCCQSILYCQSLAFLFEFTSVYV